MIISPRDFLGLGIDRLQLEQLADHCVLGPHQVQIAPNVRFALFVFAVLEKSSTACIRNHNQAVPSQPTSLALIFFAWRCLI